MATRTRATQALAGMIVGGLLAACGGGGGGDGGASPPPDPGATSVALGGTAAKGLMAGADVAVFAVDASGAVGSTALASTTTDTSGHYTLSFAASQGQPYVVRVAAKADGSTTHLDEVTGTRQALPAGFVMRALLVPQASGSVTTSANVTPFSELAVAAAARAAGGITAANTEQAVSTVKQLLGFDPAAVDVKAAGTAGASEDEKRQAILLLAVSRLANDGALGCAAATPGAQVRCVVETLAAAGSTASIKLAAGATDVSAALAAAVAGVLADTTLNGGITPATLATVTANLACTGSCAAAPVATVAAVASAKALFTQLGTDWAAMFSTGGVSAIATGPANSEAWKFRQAQASADAPLKTLLRDLGALVTGVDLYNDYKAGRTLLPRRGRAANGDRLDSLNTDTPAAAANYDAVFCTLYTDASATTEASTPANANVIGCRASSFVNIVGTVFTDWRHGFTLTPAGNGSFGYTTRTRKRVNNCVGTTCTIISNEALQSNAYAGTLTTTTDAGGAISGFAVSGELAAPLDDKLLVGDHATWQFTGTRTPGASGGYTDTITGNLVLKDAAAAVLGTLLVSQGSLDFVAARVDARGRHVKPGSPQDIGPGLPQGDGGRVAFSWSVPSAEFVATLAVEPGVWDKSGYDRVPARATLTGSLRNVAGGVVTEFVSGTLSTVPVGYANFDNTLSDSASNLYTIDMSFRGTVTAPNRPVLELTVAASNTSFDRQVHAATLQYRTLVAGQPRSVVDVTATRSAGGVWAWRFAEATSGLALTWDEASRQAALRKGSELIGSYDAATRLMTFADRSVVSLDIGL